MTWHTYSTRQMCKLVHAREMSFSWTLLRLCIWHLHWYWCHCSSWRWTGAPGCSVTPPQSCQWLFLNAGDLTEGWKPKRSVCLKKLKSDLVEIVFVKHDPRAFHSFLSKCSTFCEASVKRSTTNDRGMYDTQWHSVLHGNCVKMFTHEKCLSREHVYNHAFDIRMVPMPLLLVPMERPWVYCDSCSLLS